MFTPKGFNASLTALAIAAGAVSLLASPAPLEPKGSRSAQQRSTVSYVEEDSTILLNKPRTKRTYRRWQRKRSNSLWQCNLKLVGARFILDKSSRLILERQNCFRSSLYLDFVEARSIIEKKDHSMRDKLTTFEQAVKLVKNGDSVAIGGIMYSRTPMGMIREIIVSGVKGLTVSRLLFSFESDLMFVAGNVTTAVTSWISMAVTWGVSKIMRHYAEHGIVKIEEWSHSALNLRYKAGALGVPFLPTLSMLGSDLMNHTNVKEMDCPFTGKKLCLVPALFPDVAIIHVQRADKYGNAQVDGMPFADADMARAASKVIITTEQIVSSERIRRESDRTFIPFFCVDAVVEAPFGSYPHECPGLYQADYEFFHKYGDLVNEKGVDGVRQYLNDYISGTSSYYDYLQKFHVRNLLKNVTLCRELMNE